MSGCGTSAAIWPGSHLKYVTTFNVHRTELFRRGWKKHLHTNQQAWRRTGQHTPLWCSGWELSGSGGSAFSDLSESCRVSCTDAEDTAGLNMCCLWSESSIFHSVTLSYGPNVKVIELRVGCVILGSFQATCLSTSAWHLECKCLESGHERKSGDQPHHNHVSCCFEEFSIGQKTNETILHVSLDKVRVLIFYSKSSYVGPENKSTRCDGLLFMIVHVTMTRKPANIKISWLIHTCKHFFCPN